MQLQPRSLSSTSQCSARAAAARPSWSPPSTGPRRRRSSWNSSLFDVTADDTGLGQQLHANYLGLKDSRRPGITRFSSTPYAFSVKLRDKAAEAKVPSHSTLLRLVWHDYPGDWFEEDVSEPELAAAQGCHVQVSARL